MHRIRRDLWYLWRLVVRGTKIRVLAVGLAAASAVALPAALPDRPGLPGPAAARAAAPKGPLDRAVARLQAAQRDDGGFGTTPGARPSDPATSAWAALALASVGVHPADQPRRGTTALAYLEARAGDLTATEDLARVVLVLAAAGRGAGDAARDAARELARRQRPDGGLPDRSTGPARLGPTAFAVLALATADDADARAAVGRGATWLRAAAGPGGWGVAPGSPARPDTTALGLQALQAAEPGEVPLSQRAYDAFGRRANPDGGFGGSDRRRSTAPATAAVLQGIRAFGVDPAKYVALNGTNSTNTVAYLRGLQRPDGGFGDTTTTARVLPGLNGVAFPLRPVGRGSDRANGSAPEPEDDGSADRRAAGPASPGGAEALQGARAGGT
ncbi:MAG: hypothetical protein F2817_18625, partial [Actinobacteria bacterium]|nr:hypothetical protein [Actinomycetota bacterium]